MVNGETMNVKLWKCPRCNLVFNDEAIAELHVRLTKHPLKKKEFTAN